MSTDALAPASRRRAWWTALVAGMASYIDSAAIVTTGIAIVMLQKPLGLSAVEVGSLSSILTFSIAVGALTGGRLGDRFGRRRVFLVTMLVIVAAIATILIAGSFVPLLIGICLLGLATGADLPVSLATISEAATSSNRGGLVTFSHLLWKFGIIASQGLGALFGGLEHAGARILYAHIGIVAVLVFVARLSIPESSRWLTTRNHRLQEALTGVVPTDQRVGSLVRRLVTKPFVIPFVALLVFYTLTNLGANTNGQFGAYVFVNVAGATVQTYSFIGLITTIVGFLLVPLLMRVVDGRNRLRWFVLGASAALLGSALQVVVGSTVPTLTVMLVLWSIFSVFAGEPMMKVWTQESFPTGLRSTAQGAIIAVARAFAGALALVTPLLLDSNPRVLFGLILLVTLIGTGTAYLVFRRRTVTEFDREDAVVAADAPASAEPADRS